MSRTQSNPIYVADWDWQRSTGVFIDRYTLVAVMAFVYAVIASPLIMYVTITPVGGHSAHSVLQNLMAPNPINKIFWPMLAAIGVIMLLINWSRLKFPPHIICFMAYLGFAGLSALWAFKPDLSFQRFVLQAAIVASIVFPIMLAPRTADVLRALFICFGVACAINVVIIANQSPIIIDDLILGYPGYFSFKGTLGICAAFAILLAFHEMLYSGYRRALAMIVIVLAATAVVFSQSKGSLGMAVIAPVLAGGVLWGSRVLRVSPALILLPIPICYWILDKLIGNLVYRISWYIYGNYTLSGRAHIWDYVKYETAQRPLLGWGYQSFWVVGPDGPSIANAPGWIKMMPSGHSGYLDTRLELGYIGIALLVAVIFATIHAIGRVQEFDLRRAWLLLSLALFVVLTNFLETVWMHGSDIAWLPFIAVAAEAARYWHSRRPHVRYAHA